MRLYKLDYLSSLSSMHYRYLKYVLRHKWYVLKASRRLGITWRGLLHDLSKFSSKEWSPYVYYFYGSKVIPKYDAAFDKAWLHHQHHNRHHWQHYILHNDDGSIEYVEMPLTYVKEMVADWVGAGLAQGNPDTQAWWLSNCHKIKLHEKSRSQVVKLLEEIGAG